MSQKSKKTYALHENYYDYNFSISNQKDKGEILYQQRALLPVLEVELIVQERSRDQLGAIETTILKFMDQEINNPSTITDLLGFTSARKIVPIIEELRGQGLCKLDNKNYYITELGSKSLEIGCAVLETERSFLLCGVSGKLLPRIFYRLERISVENLSSKIWKKVPIQESNSIPLDALQFDALENKYDFNVPDEVIEATELIKTTPYFIEASLSVTKQSNHESINLSVQNEPIDWLNKQQVLPLVEPIGWEQNLSRQQIVEKIADELKEIGFYDANISIGEYEEVKVYLNNVSDESLETTFEGTPLLAYIGADQYPAISLNRFPFLKREKESKDVLGGHPLYLKTSNIDLLQAIHIYRTIYSAEKAFYAIPFKEHKNKQFHTFVLQYLTEQNINDSDIAKIVERFGSKFWKKHLISNEDNE